MTEERRYIAKIGNPQSWKNEDVYVKGHWETEWRKTKRESLNWDFCEGIYPGWDEEIAKSNERYFCPKELSPLGSSVWNDMFFLFACCNNPAIEMYAKAGMSELVEFLSYRFGKSEFVNRKKKKPEEQLKINKDRLKDLIEKKGNTIFLDIYQIEKKNNCRFTEEQVKFLRRFPFDTDRIKKALRFMTLTQFMNKVEKYSKQQRKEKSSEIFYDAKALMEYSDYLDMRCQLGYDMTNTVYLFPKNLRKSHDKMVKEMNARKDEMHIAKKMNEFPMEEGLMKRLNAKYAYRTDEYSIRPAENVAEIIMEGRTLHHCVGGDNYLRKHSKGVTTICFLRTEPGTSYITIEVKDKEILQWYGINDTKPNKEVVQSWIDEWMQTVTEKEEKKRKKTPAAVIEQKILQEAI